MLEGTNREIEDSLGTTASYHAIFPIDNNDSLLLEIVISIAVLPKKVQCEDTPKRTCMDEFTSQLITRPSMKVVNKVVILERKE